MHRHADAVIRSLDRIKLCCQWNGADDFDLWLTVKGEEIGRGHFTGAFFDKLINDRKVIASGPVILGRDGRDVTIDIRNAGAFPSLHSETLRDVILRAIKAGKAHGMTGWAQAARPVKINMTREEEAEVREFLRKRRSVEPP